MSTTDAVKAAGHKLAGLNFPNLAADLAAVITAAKPLVEALSKLLADLKGQLVVSEVEENAGE